jgi:hypothetical protein
MGNMTASADFMDAGNPVIEPIVTTDGSRMVLRILQRLVGFSLALAAAALWIAPGANWEADVMLFKLILSITSIVAGLGLMHASARPAAPEIEIDTIRREVRLVRRSRVDGDTVLSRSSFTELGKAELDGPNIRLWDAQMTLIAEVTLYDQDARRSLVGGLRDEGKLD